MSNFLKDSKKMKIVLRKIGSVGSNFWLAYGSYMVLVESACLGHCLAGCPSYYDEDIGIDLPIIDDIVEGGISLWNSFINNFRTLDGEASIYEPGTPVPQ